jgi:hypothetical protein
MRLSSNQVSGNQDQLNKGLTQLRKLLTIGFAVALSSCTLVTLPIAVVETTASIVKVPISAVGSVADAVSGSDEDGED